jgi:hypothetical protein
VYLFHLGQFFDLQHMLTFDLGPGLFSATAPYSNLPNSFVELIFRASVRTKTRYFSIVSQVSPSGADSFEDLAVIDTSAPGEWLLIVAVERGNDRVVFRRLYAGGG